jgi:hypothetical protein
MGVAAVNFVVLVTKKFTKRIAFVALAVSALLAGYGCTYEPLDFLSPESFDVSSSEQDFDVKTKQEHYVDYGLMVNNEEYFHCIDTITGYADTLDYGAYIVVENPHFYVNEDFPDEIVGEWFRITLTDKRTKHVHLSANNEGADRTLSFRLFRISPSYDIQIIQRGKTGK